MCIGIFFYNIRDAVNAMLTFILFFFILKSYLSFSRVQFQKNLFDII